MRDQFVYVLVYITFLTVSLGVLWAWQQHWAFAVWLVACCVVAVACLWAARRIVGWLAQRGII